MGESSLHCPWINFVLGAILNKGYGVKACMRTQKWCVILSINCPLAHVLGGGHKHTCRVQVKYHMSALLLCSHGCTCLHFIKHCDTTRHTQQTEPEMLANCFRTADEQSSKVPLHIDSQSSPSRVPVESTVESTVESHYFQCFGVSPLRSKTTTVCPFFHRIVILTF